MKQLAMKFLLKTRKERNKKKKIDSVYEKRQLWKKNMLQITKAIANEVDETKKNDMYQNWLRLLKAMDKTSKYSYIRYRKMCSITGRKRGVQLGLGRGYLRHYAGFGFISGIKKF